MDFINKYSIDSFKYKIRLNSVSILDKRLIDNYILVHEDQLLNNGSLEIDESFFKTKSLAINDNGIKTKFLIQKQFISNTKEHIDFLVILINAKTLKENYFNGINYDNIKQVYDYLMSLKIVRFSYQSFLWGTVSDLDIKIDFIVSDHKLFYEKTLEEVEKTKKSSKSLRGYRFFNKQNNRGIEFGDRVRATESVPFFKLYSKKTQLENITITNKDKFYPTYLNHLTGNRNLSKLIRAEFTLKNKKAIEKFLDTESLKEHDHQKSNELGLILKVSQETFLQAIQKIKKIHIQEQDQQIKSFSDVTPTDQLILNLIQSLIQFKPDLHYVQIKSICLNGFKDKQKQRIKKKVEHLYFTHIFNGTKQEVLELEKELESAFKMIGFIL